MTNQTHFVTHIQNASIHSKIPFPNASSSSLSYNFSSIHKIILSIVMDLLSGVVCGTLIGFTMFLAWSLFAHNFFSDD